eukprot:6197408-Pleurochrysis_carterae.AAC.1
MLDMSVAGSKEDLGNDHQSCFWKERRQHSLPGLNAGRGEPTSATTHALIPWKERRAGFWV